MLYGSAVQSVVCLFCAGARWACGVRCSVGTGRGARGRGRRGAVAAAGVAVVEFLRLRISHDIIERQIDALVDRSRAVDGVPTSRQTSGSILLASTTAGRTASHQGR